MDVSHGYNEGLLLFFVFMMELVENGTSQMNLRFILVFQVSGLRKTSIYYYLLFLFFFFNLRAGSNLSTLVCDWFRQLETVDIEFCDCKWIVNFIHVCIRITSFQMTYHTEDVVFHCMIHVYNMRGSMLALLQWRAVFFYQALLGTVNAMIIIHSNCSSYVIDPTGYEICVTDRCLKSDMADDV